MNTKSDKIVEKIINTEFTSISRNYATDWSILSNLKMNESFG